MKFFFSMRHSGAIRNFGSVLRGLADDGHDIHLSFITEDKIGDERIVKALANDYPSITYGWLAKRTDVRWFEFARAVRFTIDLLRYRLPMYSEAHALAERAERRVPRIARVVTRLPVFRLGPFNAMCRRALVAVLRAVPVDPVIEADVLSRAPDMLLVSPLVDLGSDQVDYVKVARKHGIRSALCVHSWDNLTNKGLMRLLPDKAYVWNETQKQEAVELHGMDPSAVVVTGAATYDQWFDWSASVGAAEFKRKVGLDPERPYFLYLCSSPFIAPMEIDFIESWVAAIRGSDDPALEGVGLLIRPHPENRQPWHRLDMESLGNTVIWPVQGANPVNRDTRSDYYDSIFHSSGIVGINTSGLIESGIIGRRVFTVEPPEFADTQGGTLHYGYLTSIGGGLVQRARDLAEHRRQIEEFLVGAGGEQRHGQEFVREFVRPHGLEVNSTERYVRELEEQGAAPSPAPQARGVWQRFVAATLAPIAYFMHWKSRLVKMRRKQERAAQGGGLASQILNAPREAFFRVFNEILRRKRVRAFLNRYVIPRVAGDEQTFPEMAVTERQVQRLARSPKDKIIVGPWLSEVGFEVLYWIPFLNWVRAYRDIDPERLVVISRGGVAPWYQTVTNNYLDILDFMTPDQYLRLNEERMAQGKQKQRAMSEFDRDVLRMAKQVLKQKDAEILHPSTMYNLFMPYWKRRATVNLLERFTVFCRYPEIDSSDIAADLPDEYIAARFYFNDSFPDTEQNREFVFQLLARLTANHEVVLLNPGFEMDDHSDFHPEQLDHIHTIGHLMTPSTNLAVQTQVISRASAFVGTYGGLSYLPPFYGVNSLALYSHSRGFLYHHLELANRVFLCLDSASFTALNVRDTDLVNAITGSPYFPTTPRRGTSRRIVLTGPGSLDNEKTDELQSTIKPPAFLVEALGQDGVQGGGEVSEAGPVREHAPMEPRRILFVMQYPGYLRYFDSVLQGLAKRGHEVMVAFDNPRKQSEGLVCLNGDSDDVEVLGAVPQRKDHYRYIARGLRTSVDYARYLHPDYEHSPYLRERMGNVLPAPMRFMKKLPTLGARSSKFVTGSLAALERGVPASDEVRSYLEGLNLDAVVVTPLVTDGSTQVDVVKAAQELGIRTALCVASWDHLTTKGLVRLAPDRIFVWNEVQKREAVKYHHVTGHTVRIVGAHPFDRWFGREPSTSRAEFCEKVGLSGDGHYVLFVGSTASISAPEAEIEFVLEWIRRLRDSDEPSLRDVGVLIRPHPYNPGAWADVDLSGLGDVAVFPLGGSNPVDDADRTDYFDSLYHCAAVVGVNTTAMIEAAIVDRPVHTIETDRFKNTQGGTLHFHYMLEKNEGFVRVASSFDEHLAQLSDSLTGPDSAHVRNAAFVRSFLRPHGPGTPCTPVVVRQIEVLAKKQLKPRRAVPRRYLPVNATFSLLGRMAGGAPAKKSGR